MSHIYPPHAYLAARLESRLDWLCGMSLHAVELVVHVRPPLGRHSLRAAVKDKQSHSATDRSRFNEVWYCRNLAISENKTLAHNQIFR